MIKECTKCKKLKFFWEFSPKKSGKFGLCAICKECRRPGNRKACKRWYDKNSKHKKQCVKQWRQNNKDHYKETIKQWRENNKERYEKWKKEYQKKYYETNKERLKDYIYHWNKTLKGKSSKLKYVHKRRAIMKNTDITIDFLSNLKISYIRCPLCGEWRPNHLDHIIPLKIGGTHTKNNVRFLCEYCNLARPIDGSDLKNILLE